MQQQQLLWQLRLPPSWSCFNAQESASGEELFAQNFEPYEIGKVPRSGGEDSTATKESPFDLYEKGAYQKAIPGLQNLLDAEPQNGIAALCLGISYLRLPNAQPDKAIVQFARIVPKDSFYRAGQWYTALAHLRKNDKASAQPILEKLASIENGHYPNRARKLLRQL